MITIFIKLSFQDFLSSSTLDKCYQNGSSLITNCKQKMVVQLSIENGQNVTTESLTATIQQLDNKNGSSSLLENPIKIEVTKTPVFAIFPLTYQQDFNSKPIERVVSSTVFSCKDGFYSDNPTCGFKFDSNNQKIMDSQGYCCSCDFKDIIGLGDDITRGKICSAFNLGEGSATAHCLDYSQLWYSAFQIEVHQIYYEIQVKISTLSGNSVISEQILNLGSQIRVAKNSDQSVIAKIIGDFYPLNPPAELSNYYLMKPSIPVTDPRVLESTRAWMFVDRESVTLDGTECNKIGISYSAFKYESDNCNKMIGSCLRNQLDDLYNQDLQRINNGLQPQYLLSSKGNFMAMNLNSQTALMQQIIGTMSSVITLELNADKIQFKTILGVGDIDFAKINDFESLSSNGILIAQITNTGQLAAEFNIQINCSQNVASISSQSFYLNSQQTVQLQRDVRVIGDGNSNNTCVLQLLDAIGNLLDSYNLNFSTIAIQHINQQNNNTDSYGANKTQQQQQIQNKPTCSEICSSFWDIICFIGNGCTSEIFKFLSVIIVAILSLVFLYQMHKRGYLCCCCKSKQNNQQNCDQEKYQCKQQYQNNQNENKQQYHNQQNNIKEQQKQTSFQQYIDQQMNNHLDYYLNVDVKDFNIQKFKLSQNFSIQVKILFNEQGAKYIKFADKKRVLNFMLNYCKSQNIAIEQFTATLFQIQKIAEQFIDKFISKQPKFNELV